MELGEFSMDNLCSGGGGELPRINCSELRFYSEAMNIPNTSSGCQVKSEPILDDLDFDTNFYEQLLDTKVLDFEAEPVQTTNQWGFPDNVKIEDIFQVEQGDLNLSPTLAELNASSDPGSSFDYVLAFSPDDLDAKPIAAGSESQLLKTGTFLETGAVTSMDWTLEPAKPPQAEIKPAVSSMLLSSSCPAQSHLVHRHGWHHRGHRAAPVPAAVVATPTVASKPADLFSSTELEDKKPSLLSTSAPASSSGLLSCTLRQRTNSNTDRSLGSLSSLSISNDEGFDSHGEDSNPEDDLSSDGESLFTEELGADDKASLMLELSSATGACKKKKRYFWQYNTQSKGPKGSRLQLEGAGSSAAADPHIFHDVTDPVFSADGLAPPGVKHSGKARRGDGNDLTPNPRKLFSIGLELRKLNKVINELAPGDLDLDARPVSRKEKNKLASRACRLKKKAQHEANKLKLHGLQEEHKKLLTFLPQMRPLLSAAVKGEASADQLAAIARDIDEVQAVAGQTTEYVNRVLERVARGDNSGGLQNA